VITALELRERLQYDPNTGLWVWLKTPRKGFEGKPAGSIDAYGYRCIKIDGQSYKASRLAYLYMTGEWPEEEMDHIDRTPWNDAWHNLRPATVSENRQNRQMRTDNNSGAIGVFWNEARKKWQVQVNKIHVGLYDDFDEAVAARDNYVKHMHGDFAVLNTPKEGEAS
jgi:HNH endonuclease